MRTDLKSINLGALLISIFLLFCVSFAALHKFNRITAFLYNYIDSVEVNVAIYIIFIRAKLRNVTFKPTKILHVGNSSQYFILKHVCI